ncbi:phasin family protein [Rhodobium gokarnense]|uniref:Phasin domain-containing protein n=1 Tax=Rhodobium gokarnense TaxID=364296 RepID=A0ABT3H685_9HYPH|nr:phasin family protein [Rhodobium gokarnense]MCW2305904.1 hypothetical protein [Rhodobium gokarnense]
MTTKRTKQAATMAAGMPAAFLPEAMSTGLVAMARTQSRLATTAIDTNVEVLDFLRNRLQKDRDLIDEIADCKDAMEMMDAWLGFWSEAFTGYTDEFTKVAFANVKTASDAVQEISREATVGTDAGGIRPAA